MSLKHKRPKSQSQTKKKKHLSPPGSDIPMALNIDYKNPLRGKDFFQFVNGKWLHTVNVPPHITSFGVSEELDQSIKTVLRSIVTAAVEKSKAPTSKTYSNLVETAIGLVSQSALNAKVQSKSVKTVASLLADLRCIRDTNDVAKTMADLAKCKIKGLFWLFAQYENSNKTNYTYTIGIGRVGLPDISYYKKTGPGKGKTLLKYANFLQRVGTHFEIPNLSEIIPVEKLLAGAIQKSLMEKFTSLKGSQLEKEFPKIPFDILFQTLELESWRNELFFIDARNWLETLQKMFQYLPIETWKLLFATEILLHFLPYLPPPFDDLYFEFFHNYLRGQTQKIPQKDLIIETLTDWMTPFLSRLYIYHFGKPEIKRDVGRFVKELLEIAKIRLGSTEWLQPKTRKEAREKIEKMRTSIGYPDSFAKLPIPSVNSENFVKNLLELGAWQTSYEISRLGEKREKQKDWDEPVFAVNAYYYSQSNEMVIPLGSLYWPFYSKTAPLGWNYGGLGCILSHEMCHAFDKEGKEYDPDGFSKKWWTPSDNRAFNKITKNLIQLYSSQKVLSHSVSGSLTLSENIADLGGMAIALDALKQHIHTHSYSKEEQKKAFQQFFISYAVSWRVKEKPEKILQSLFLDHHSPPRFRVNLIISQFQEWYDAFDITEEDPMYIPPEKRIQIF